MTYTKTMFHTTSAMSVTHAAIAHIATGSQRFAAQRFRRNSAGLKEEKRLRAASAREFCSEAAQSPAAPAAAAASGSGSLLARRFPEGAT